MKSREELAVKLMVEALERRELGCDSYCSCYDGHEDDCVRCKWEEDQRDMEMRALSEWRKA